MSALRVFVDGIGLLGPGFDSWEQACPVLKGEVAAQPARTRVPAPQTLPAAERRRAGLAVKASLAVGLEALQAGGASAATMATVFTSSSGDGANCHDICSALASAERVISPTRFHNSVHNAPSGYWSISSGARAASSVLCAHDGSFAAGLLEAMAQVVVEGRPVLLVSYDTDYPEPLYGVRPTLDTMGLALLLVPNAGTRSLASLTLDAAAAFTAQLSQTLADPVLEQMRTGIPTARGLPLLRALALRETGTVVIDYLDDLHLAVQAQPC